MVKNYYTTCKFTNKKLLKPGLKLIGAKTRSRDLLYQYKPAGVVNYIEPMLGSGTCLIGQEPNANEYVNDININVINFYKTMVSDSDRLWRHIVLNVSFIEQDPTGAYWKELRDNEYKIVGLLGSDEAVYQAAWFYCITKYALNGIYRRNKSGRCNSSWCKTVKGRGIYTREWFDLVRERIKNVTFCSGDYKTFLDNLFLIHNLKDYNTWMLVDPPYRECKTTYNGISFSDQDHIILRDTLTKYSKNTQWLLTINDDEFIRDLYKDYNIVEHKPFYSCSQTASGRGKSNELIIMNY